MTRLTQTTKNLLSTFSTLTLVASRTLLAAVSAVLVVVVGVAALVAAHLLAMWTGWDALSTLTLVASRTLLAAVSAVLVVVVGVAALLITAFHACDCLQWTTLIAGAFAFGGEGCAVLAGICKID
jgi:hypothetical protein